MSGRLLLGGCVGGRRRCRSLLCASIARSSSGRLSRVGVLLVFPTLQSLEVDLGNSLVKCLALGGSELQLLLGGLARAVAVL